jgi:hypothetical protein
MTGCPTNGGDDDDGTIKDAKMYTVDGGKIVEYKGDGTKVDLTGYLSGGGDDEEPLDNPVGSISAEGKLTLNIPATIADGKLVDAGVGGLKYAFLDVGNHPTGIYLTLVKANAGDDFDDAPEVSMGYYNKDYSSDEGSVKKGWSYSAYIDGERTALKNLDGCIWVLMSYGN